MHDTRPGNGRGLSDETRMDDFHITALPGDISRAIFEYAGARQFLTGNQRGRVPFATGTVGEGRSFEMRNQFELEKFAKFKFQFLDLSFSGGYVAVMVLPLIARRLLVCMGMIGRDDV